MLNKLKDRYEREQFEPTAFLGLFCNPYYIIRRRLLTGVKALAAALEGGDLLDVGCGSKPYRHHFQVNRYVGLELATDNRSERKNRGFDVAIVDDFYEGRHLPYPEGSFDSVFSSEVFEHVFNLDELLSEIHRVLRPGGNLAFTCPFVWDEHQQPADFARYTSFAFPNLLTNHGFELVWQRKSSNFVETLAQMTTTYIWQHLLPKNALVRATLFPFIAPINFVGIVLGRLLPRSDGFYLNNIVLARKT